MLIPFEEGKLNEYLVFGKPERQDWKLHDSTGRELVKTAATKTDIHRYVDLCYPFLYINENNNSNGLLIVCYSLGILLSTSYVFCHIMIIKTPKDKKMAQGPTLTKTINK